MGVDRYPLKMEGKAGPMAGLRRKGLLSGTECLYICFGARKSTKKKGSKKIEREYRNVYP